MLLNISIILIAVALLSLLIYLFCASRRRKKENRFARRFFGGVAVLCTLAAAVLFIIYCKSNNIKIFNKLKEYDPVESYTQSLAKDGAEAAFAIVPDAVFSQGNNVYFKNGKGDLFTVEYSEESAAFDTKTVYNGAVFVDGGKTLRAIITDENELILDGYLQYSVYDGQKIEFENKVVATDVAYCSLTNNSVLYITTDGKLYALGFNEYGQLGDTTTKNKASATLVTDNISRCSISDTHSMTVDSFGIFKAVGDNSYSQLGNKTAVSAQEPIKIMQGIKDVKAGNYFSVVLAVNGQLFTAGNNELGQLGNGGEAFKAELIPIMNGVKKVDVCGNTIAALTFDGELFVWGDNTGCKAGVPNETVLPSPVKIKDGVFDFTLFDTGVAIITDTRDILISDAKGSINTALTFNAQIPVTPDDSDVINSQNQTDAA